MNEESEKNGEIRDKEGKFLRGNPGKPKGAKSRFTNLKNAFLEVFENIGGTKGLEDWVEDTKHNKTLFYGWITKMLPSSVTGGQDEEGEFKPLTVIINHDGNKPD